MARVNEIIRESEAAAASYRLGSTHGVVVPSHHCCLPLTLFVRVTNGGQHAVGKVDFTPSESRGKDDEDSSKSAIRSFGAMIKVSIPLRRKFMDTH